MGVEGCVRACACVCVRACAGCLCVRVWVCVRLKKNALA